MTYIEIKNVFKSYQKKQVLNNIELTIEKGEFATFLGPSGCGKTTLLRCLSGLEKVDRGSLHIDGMNVTNIPAGDRGVGMVFQQYSLFPTMTVKKNISFGLRMQGVHKKEIEARVAHVLEMVNLKGHEHKYIYQLSGGEQQRVALARGLVMNPKVLLLDEPFSAIDAKLRKELQHYLKRIHKELDMTTIFVTHDQEEAMRVSDRIHLFNTGVLEQSGHPEDVYKCPKTEFVASFMGHYNLLSAEVFEQMASIRNMSCKRLAFRPEVVKFADDSETSDKGYSFEGLVKDYIVYGNIIRYIVATQHSIIHVDSLFDRGVKREIGKKVELFIEKDYVLAF